jgi:hypothetical protein
MKLDLFFANSPSGSIPTEENDALSPYVSVLKSATFTFENVLVLLCNGCFFFRFKLWYLPS